MKREFTVVVEQGEDGYLVGSVPAIPGCYSQGRTMAELLDRVREAIALCLVAGCVDDGNAGLLELALSGAKTDEAACRKFLASLLIDPDERIRSAAERTSKALDLR